MKNLKRIIILIIIAIFLLAIGFIYLGVSLDKKANSKDIFLSVYDNIFNKINDFLWKNEKSLKNDFEYTSNINITNTLNDLDVGNNANYELLKDITKEIKGYNANYTYKQNKSKKKLFLQSNEKLNGEELNSKLLVENATLYYKIDNYTNNYVNKGTNNYFETELYQDNFTYLKNFISNSFKNNLKDNYFSKYDEEISLNKEKLKVKRISIKFNSDVLEEILKNIYNDLKNDEKASLIIESFNQDFKKSKYDFSNILKDTVITVNIYVDRVFSKIKRIELVNLTNNNESMMAYEEGNLYFINNDKVDFYVDIKNKNITIYNSKDKNIGSIDIEKNNKKKEFNFYLNDTNNHLEFKFNENYNTVDEKLTKSTKIGLVLTVKKNDIINLAINENSTYSDVTEILENVDDAVLESSLDKSVKRKINSLEDSKFLLLIK